MTPRPAARRPMIARASQATVLVVALGVVVACSAAPTPVVVAAPQSAAISSAVVGPVVRLSPLTATTTAQPQTAAAETLTSGVPPLSLPPTGYPSPTDETTPPATTATTALMTPTITASTATMPTVAKPPPLSTAPKPAPPSPAKGSSATSSAALSAAAGMTPVAVATGWLVAYRQASWTQPVTAWIARVRPYVTDKLYRSYLPLAGKGGGADWRTFVAGKCTATPGEVGGVIPPEAPHSAMQVFVQVGGTLHTTCTAGARPPDEPLAATLTLLHTPAGWRVDARQY